MFFFDLEQTLMESWECPVPMNKQLVDEWKENFSISEIFIFSFAIWDEKDKETFNSQMKWRLEKFFGFTIVDVVTKDEVFQTIKNHRKIAMDEHDFTDFFNKENSFLEWARIKFEDDKIFLFDDMVSNMSVTDSDKQLEINFIKS